MRLLTSLVLAVALIGCGSTSTPTDLTATNAAIGANTTAVDNLSGKMDASSDKVVAAITALGPKLDALVPADTAAPAPIDPNVCTIPTGMTPTTVDGDGHVKGTVDALVDGLTLVSCDVGSLQGWQAWHLKGLRMGTKANGQDGLLVDSANNAVNIDDVRNGHYYSSKPTKAKGKQYTVTCLGAVGPDACKAKPVEKSATSITVVLPRGAKIVTGSGS